MEQLALYNAINMTSSAQYQSAGVYSAFSAENATALRVALEVYVCPSDGGGLRSGSSYRCCAGPYPGTEPFREGVARERTGGVFSGLRAITVAEVSDGLSNTVGFSERLLGSGGSRIDRNRDIWYSSFGSIYPGTGMDSDQVASACAALSVPDPDFLGQAGKYWMGGRYNDTMYNHVATPNWDRTDCSVSGTETPLAPIAIGCVSASSNHPQGVHVLMLDGATRFVKRSVQLSLWRSLSSRGGGEVLDQDAY